MQVPSLGSKTTCLGGWHAHQVLEPKSYEEDTIADFIPCGSVAVL